MGVKKSVTLTFVPILMILILIPSGLAQSPTARVAGYHQTLYTDVIEQFNELETITFLPTNLQLGGTQWTLSSGGGGRFLYFRDSGGTDIMTISSLNNRVGIGTINPGQILDVAGPIKIGGGGVGVAGSIRWTGSDFEVHNGSGWSTMVTSSSGSTTVWSLNGNDAYYNSGNVGIGTSSPSEALQVDGRIMIDESSNGRTMILESDGAQYIRTTQNLNIVSGGTGLIVSSPSTFNGNLQVVGTARATNVEIGNSGNYALGESAPGRLSLTYSGTENFVFLDSGDFGAVNGGVLVANSSLINQPGLIRYNEGLFQGWVAGSGWENLNGGGSSLWQASAGNISRMTGYVGIGTNTPTYNLHVVGTARVTTGLRVDGRAYVLGDLGVGTISPSVKLDVWGDSKLNGNVDINGAVDVNGNTDFNGNVNVSNNLDVHGTFTVHI